MALDTFYFFVAAITFKRTVFAPANALAIHYTQCGTSFLAFADPDFAAELFQYPIKQFQVAMKLSEIKQHLSTAEAVNFILPDGSYVLKHFHVTEVGSVTKHFIDCGGTERTEKAVNFQLWDANDYEHRLKPQKLLNIIALSEKRLGIADEEIEVEYQSGTIGKYGLDFNETDFILVPKQTACLAQDACCVPKQKVNLSELKSESTVSDLQWRMN